LNELKWCIAQRTKRNEGDGFGMLVRLEVKQLLPLQDEPTITPGSVSLATFLHVTHTLTLIHLRKKKHRIKTNTN
jgi:hypothetical protein